jgi:TIR domain
MKSLTVFISHNKANKEVARNIALFLVAENINVWFDEWEISAGDSIIEKLNSGLKECTHFLIIWSKNSSTSKWVGRELSSVLTKAIESGTPKVIPIILDDSPLPQLLVDLRYIRYLGGSEKDRIKIIESITGHKPSSDFIRAVVKKYNEEIYDFKANVPLPYNACPSCGSKHLNYSEAIDSKRDDMYYFIECQECGWSDWSQ